MLEMICASIIMPSFFCFLLEDRESCYTLIERKVCVCACVFVFVFQQIIYNTSMFLGLNVGNCVSIVF